MENFEGYTRPMKKSATILAVIMITAVWFPNAIFAQKDSDGIKTKTKIENTRFTDVDNDSYFFVPLNYLREKGLVQGYSDGTFHPERLVNRAEALAMIMKATEIEINSAEDEHQELNSENPIQITLPKSSPIIVENLKTGEKTTLNDVTHLRINVDVGEGKVKMLRPKTSEKPFRDVSEKAWFFDIVSEGKRLGFINGYENGKYFKPTANVNLAEALRMLFQISGTQSNLASDAPLPPGVPADAWYANDIAYGVLHTIITQQDDGSIFSPGKDLSRGELSLLLYRFLRTKENASFGFASWYGDGLAKTKLTNGLDYREKNLTAAHKTIPFGSIVKVTNMANGKTVKVVINDRGPFVTGRIIDLSRTAFSALESTTAGIISVRIELAE